MNNEEREAIRLLVEVVADLNEVTVGNPWHAERLEKVLELLAAAPEREEA